ncbi:MAG: hypothetical protein AAF597_08460 [Bacteroidota bacterium]
MDELDFLEESEFNNSGELLGLDDALDGELGARMRRMGPMRRMRLMSKLAKGSRSRGSRAEMENFFRELPKHIRQELRQGKLRLADTTIFTIKKVTPKTIKMFETQDDKETGLSNVSNAKLPKNFAFLVSGITLLAGELPEAPAGEEPYDTNEAVKAIQFWSIYNYPSIANGEHYLKANKKQIIPEGESNWKFVTDNNTMKNLGFYKLDNPRLIQDDVLIEFTIELGTGLLIPENTYLKTIFHGTGTTP